jgi:hypothetical protein
VSAQDASAASAYRLALARARAKPAFDAIEQARTDLGEADRHLAKQIAAAKRAPIWRRRAARAALADAVDAAAHARERLDGAEDRAVSHREGIRVARVELAEIERDATAERLRTRLRQLELRTPDRGAGRASVVIEPPSLGR